MTQPERVLLHHDGLRIGALDWGGTGEPLLLLHPNGFCAGLFDPLARRLTDSCRPIAVDLRGHGASDAPSIEDPDGLAFVRMAADVVALLDHLGIERARALGQSLGGGVATLVDRERPGLLSRLVLCEAVAFSADLASSGGRPQGTENPMASAARKRRAVWPDRETMIESYGGRAPLDVLAPEALEAYVRWGTRDRSDGSVELACDPAVEAAIFERSAAPGGAFAAWEHLAHLTAEPMVVAGDASDLPTPWFEAQAERAGTTLHQVHGGHFFLQEDTARADDLVRTWLT